MADTVTVIETQSLGDHLFKHHHFDGALIGGMPDKRREEEHARRHSAAWIAFHGFPKHAHPDEDAAREKVLQEERDDVDLMT